LFSDEESQKAREIDVVAENSARSSDGLEILYLKLVIECKKSTNAFVILCVTSEEETILNNVIRNNLRVGSEDDRFVFMTAFYSDKNQTPKDFPTPTLNIATRRGYTLLQAHQKNDSHIYAEIYKLAKAYYFEIQKDNDYRKSILSGPNSLDRAEMQGTFHFHLPILVVDAPLVEVYLDETGETQIEVKEISSVKIPLPWKVSHKDYNPDDGLSIAVVTKQAFENFAKDARTFVQEVINRREDVLQ
jgi:hypothetical protein